MSTGLRDALTCRRTPALRLNCVHYEYMAELESNDRVSRLLEYCTLHTVHCISGWRHDEGVGQSGFAAKINGRETDSIVR